MEKWAEVLGLIELILGLLVLVFLGYVMYMVIEYRWIEFNGYWRSRTLLCSAAVVWVVFLLLGNEYLWNSTDGIFGIKSKYSNAICALHVFFTVGSSEPLFFLIFLFIIKSRTSDKEQKTLYIEDPNYYVYTRSLIWTIPIVVVHIVVLILDASSVSEPKKLFWTVYDKDNNKCAVPIISTAAFAIFFVIFLFFFLLLSRNFIKSVINRTLINRLRLLQFSFIAFLPLEVAIRVVLIFTLNIGNTSIGLFHAFFFVDIAVVIVAVLEFAFFPVSDEIGFYFIRPKEYKLINSSKSDEEDVLGITMSTNSPDHLLSGTKGNQANDSSLIPISEYEKTVKDTNKTSKLQNPFKSTQTTQEISIDDDDMFDSGNNNNNKKQNEFGNVEMEKIKLSKHKSPILDRVRDTDPIQVPPLPLSTPLSSSPSHSLAQSPPHTPHSVSSTTSSSSGGHERKKSRKFSLSSKRKSTAIKSESSSATNSPLGMSPPSNSYQVRSLYQPTPVEDFKGQLYKYSQNKRF